MRVAFFTLGCRLNQYESDSLITLFKKSGFNVVNFKEFADVYVINTCTVTAKSDYKSRNAIHRAVKTNPQAFTIVTGCYAETDPEILAQIHGVDLVIANEKKHAIVEIVKAKMQGAKPPEAENSSFRFPAPVSGLHIRSYLKIQDGCDNFCSYCKVPFARGNPRSRDISDCVSAFETLVDSGIKEVVLTGINIGKFHNGIASLLHELIKIKGDYRIHLSSIELNHVTDELLTLFNTGKLCSHLHIPLQSGSDKILQLMNRRYTASEFTSLMLKIKEKIGHINLTTDVITGFPGETEEDFEKTLNLLKELQFSHVHTFRYSPRAGTAAVKLKNKVQEKIASERSEIIRQLSETQKEFYIRQFFNLPLRFLAEKNTIKDGINYTSGKTDNYIDVYIPGKLKPGEFYTISILSVENGNTLGTLINEGE